MSTPGLLDKICSREEAARRVASLPRPVVFTNGVFDVLHRGHVSYLHEARAQGGSLVVAVNTDESARMLGKGPDRPLNADIDRATVLAGLESVSLVTFFHERTPVELIGETKPDIYVKGGDYDMRALEETRVVESWGGHALAIPFVDGYSTTALVKRIRANRPAPARKAAFLDRDGTIIVEKDYLSDPDQAVLESGAVEGLRMLAGAGFELIVVSNQSGVGRGMFGLEQAHAVNARVAELLSAQGITIAGWYMCPHAPDQTCDCRKPLPGLVLQAARELNLELTGAVVIGDKRSDVELGHAIGGTGLLVTTGHGLHDADWAHAAGVPCFADLKAAAQFLTQTKTPG